MSSWFWWYLSLQDSSFYKCRVRRVSTLTTTSSPKHIPEWCSCHLPRHKILRYLENGHEMRLTSLLPRKNFSSIRFTLKYTSIQSIPSWKLWDAKNSFPRSKTMKKSLILIQIAIYATTIRSHFGLLYSQPEDKPTTLNPCTFALISLTRSLESPICIYDDPRSNAWKVAVRWSRWNSAGATVNLDALSIEPWMTIWRKLCEPKCPPEE